MATDGEAKVDRAAERAATRGTQSSPASVPDEVRYSIEELREGSSHLLGVSTPVVDGALFGATRKTFTLDEMKQRIDEFLHREHS